MIKRIYNSKEFRIPNNLLDRLYDFTGPEDSSRGYILAYVSSKGDPIIYQKCATHVVKMGLEQALNKYLNAGEDLMSDEG
jgi:hypothetical protein